MAIFSHGYQVNWRIFLEMMDIQSFYDVLWFYFDGLHDLSNIYTLDFFSRASFPLHLWPLWVEWGWAYVKSWLAEVQSSLQVLFWSLGLLGVIQCIAGPRAVFVGCRCEVGWSARNLGWFSCFFWLAGIDANRIFLKFAEFTKRHLAANNLLSNCELGDLGPRNPTWGMVIGQLLVPYMRDMTLEACCFLKNSQLTISRAMKRNTLVV